MNCISLFLSRKSCKILLCSLVLVACCCSLELSLQAQEVGDTVRLQSTSAQGVPVHPAAGDMSFERWANGTIGTVAAIDTGTGWFRVESSGNVGWVIGKYLTVIPAEPEAGEVAGSEIPSYVVGTWNLEHFKDGATRGFPENTFGGPSYGPRVDADFERIARTITEQLFVKILILNEINGRSEQTTSVEMDRLVGVLGTNWVYELTASGRGQRVAILYDTNAVNKTKCVEMAVAELRIQDKDVFDKDPLACLFTFKDSAGQAKNDLIVIGLHLASGQHLVDNHNQAMAILRTRLQQAMTDGTFPAGEKDVLIGGDLNASRYDNKVEDFWEGFDSGNFAFATLSPKDGTEYPGTRLAGRPLFPRSQIDYLMASGRTGGLVDELVQSMAQVHTELLLSGFDDYREHVSDHLPVTVRIRVINDDD